MKFLGDLVSSNCYLYPPFCVLLNNVALTSFSSFLLFYSYVIVFDFNVLYLVKYLVLFSPDETSYRYLSLLGMRLTIEVIYMLTFCFTNHLLCFILPILYFFMIFLVFTIYQLLHENLLELIVQTSSFGHVTV